MAESICETFHHTAARLMELGLGYLTFDRAASTPSTRGTSADAVRNRMTGVLYVLDVPDRTAPHEHRRTPARHAGTACRRECDHPRRPLCSDFEHGRSFYRTRSSGRAGDFSYNTGVCAIRPAMGRGGEPRHSISARRYDLLPRLRRYVLSKGGVRDFAHVQERGRRIFPAHTNVAARRRGSGRMPRFDDCAAPASNPPQARMRLPDAW